MSPANPPSPVDPASPVDRPSDVDRALPGGPTSPVGTPSATRPLPARPPAASASFPARPSLPPRWGLRLDPGVRRFAGGTQLLGGSPLRLLRLKPAGAAAVDGFEKGELIGASRGRSVLARRLLDAGMAHPVPNAGGSLRPSTVTVIIPVCDDLEGLRATLASVIGTHDEGSEPINVVVVDDGSTTPLTLEEIRGAQRPAAPIGQADDSPASLPDVGVDPAGLAADPPHGLAPGPEQERSRQHALTTGWRLIRRPVPAGPGIARQVGLAAVGTELVAFIDAGVVLPPGWLATLGAYFADPAVVAVAPRIGSQPGPSLLERYEATQSPLDLGSEPGNVAPRHRVAYVPTAMVLARRSAVVTAGGFDPGLRFGEDVDLVWRLVKGGGTVRYAPEVVVTHRPRSSWRAWWRQRVGYGSAAAPLALRHPGQVPPVQVSAWSAAAWLAVAAGHPLVALAVAGGSGAMLPAKLGDIESPRRRAWELAGRGHLLAGRWLARAVLRPYWPLALVAAILLGSRARRAVAIAAVVPALLDWRDGRSELGAVTFVAARMADDVAYGTGVWCGSMRWRTLAALRPDLSNWPGRKLKAG